MFCKNCGKELTDDAIFCPVCGTRQTEASERDGQKNIEQGNISDTDIRKNMGADAEKKKTGREAGAGMSEAEAKGAKRSFVSKIWDSPLFTRAAIKFGNLLEIIEGIIFLILSVTLFKEGGFWGIIFGIVFGLGGIGSCISGVMALLSRKKDDKKTEEMDEKEINKKKRNLCIGVVVIAIALFIVNKTGGGTYSTVKSISFDNMGTETIGELVESNIKNAEWSQKKLDGSSKLVYVEGYCPAYAETVKIEFYYEEMDDNTCEVTLNNIYLPDSGEELDAFDMAIVWGSFYH